MNGPHMESVDGIPDYLAPTDHIVLYPTFGHLSSDGQSWLVGISGVVYRPGPQNLRRRVAIRLLQRLLRATTEELQEPLFENRVNCFLAKTERGRRIAIQLGSRIYWLQRPSKRNGHFRGSLRLTRDEAADLQFEEGGANGWLTFAVATPTDDPRFFAGKAQLIGPTGVSVISDIDDTIKHSDVADRRRLLRNTFLNPFQPVPGMASLYQSWADQGAAFHYVSSSPWQLYESLQELLAASGFPAGSFHLRGIRLRDASILRLFIARRTPKLRAIRAIVRMFPERRFILVGDAGEKDPEIYGAMARRFPRQIQRIIIRRVDGKESTDERWARAFRGIDPQRWRLIDDAEEIIGESLPD